MALVAPAGPILDPGDFDRATQACGKLGLTPIVAPHANSRLGYLAGTDQLRLEDLSSALASDTIDAVWCLRGGYGVPRLLALLDFDQIARTPKPLIGFSDITALLNAMLHRAEVVAFHGPVARDASSQFSQEAMRLVLFGPEPAGVLPRHSDPVSCLQPGTVEGRLIGGNLSLMVTLLGTGYLPDPSGALLVIEEVGEECYRLDRMLAQLKLAGVLDRIAGAIIGRITEVPDSPSGSRPVADVLAEYFVPLGIPAAFGFPVGHVPDQWTLPLGVKARLDAGVGTVELLEPAVA